MKMADFDPLWSQSPELILMKLDMVDYVQDPTPYETLVAVAQRGWSGQICDSHLSIFLKILRVDSFWINHAINC